jgi:hypothetical protein
MAGIAHVLVSIMLGGVIIAVGLQFRATVQSAQDTIIGCVLILTGVGFAIIELSGRGHLDRHDHSHGHDHAHGLAAVTVPFGAAASPDLTILPVFLAATTAGLATAISSLVIFAVVTIGTIVGLTLVACFGGYQLRGQWLERWGNVFTALVLVIIGTLVLTAVI